MVQKLRQQIEDVGLKLVAPPASKDVLVKLLKQMANHLAELDQSPLPSMLEALQHCLNAVVKPELLKHHDRDVVVLVATCICEIMRITAPEAPYSDEVLRDIFDLFMGTFSGLNDISSPSFRRRVFILETLARYKFCVMMLDLECIDLIIKMFKMFFSVISDDQPEIVVTSMQSIMILILDESEDVPENLLFTILSTLGRKRNDVSLAARRLGMNVIENCAGKLETSVKQFLSSSISGDTIASSNLLDYHEVIFDIYQCAPQILFSVIPYITGELLTDQLDVRLKAVKLLGDMFALPGISISESFQPLFSEFIKRLTDRVAEVRISVIEHLKKCLISNPSRSEAPEIISALSDRLLDYDENVRREVVAAIFHVAYHSLVYIPSATMHLVAERLRDKSVSVKRYTLERLAELYKLYCKNNSDGSIITDNFEWIPGKILRCIYDKDFRSETIEDILCRFLFPPEFTMKDKLKHWIEIFSGLERVEVKALEQVLLQKQRLQQELQKYLSLRQMYQDEDNPEVQKKISSCFWTMSRLFNDPSKAEEGFQILNQLKDVKIWRILICLLDPSASFSQSSTSRDELLKILGEKHPLYEFMGILTMRCSYLLFNKEFVKEILLEAAGQPSDGNAKLLPSMNLLAVLACFSPMLLSGFEEDLVCLLKEDNNMIKEGVAHVLAKAGGTIREQLAMTSNSVDLQLEKLCLEGSRKQAKYSVQALAAITKDDGLKALSVLYKRLVDMLEKKTHLPAILQSLGCIAQNAMPVFETKEGEIVDFITKHILQCSNKDEHAQNFDWNARSELCLLKTFGIKTLVKSYMPLKDAHLRVGIEKLLESLKNILLFGEISQSIVSSAVDKAHLRLAAAKAVLRLSKQWDHKIPLSIFYLTLRTSQDVYHEARKIFTSKVHRYIKERFLDAKYACAFLYNITESHPLEIKEDIHSLVEVLQIHHQLKARQLSIQCDMNPMMAYPEYILTYLVHALAHHPSFPNVEDPENFQAFEPIYWRLHLFLSTLLYGNEVSQQANAGTRESFSTVVSIFHSIKYSEDIVDEAKTKNSRVLCDLGMLIANNLVKGQESLKQPITSVPLPPLLYKALEMNGSDDSLVHEERSCLGPKALAYFESLKLENKTHDAASKGENVEKFSWDSETDGSEVPLGVIMESLKSKGAKKKKFSKKRAFHSEIRNSDFEIDVLGMVREINLESQGREKTMDIVTMDKDHNHKHFTGANVTTLGSNENMSSLMMNRKMEKGLPLVSTPKRKRSFVPKSNSKVQKRGGSPFLHSSDDDKVNSNSSNPLVSSLPTKKSSTSGSRRTDRYKISNVKSHVGENNTNLMNTTGLVGNKKKIDDSLSPAHGQKRKLKSIAGLAKCSKKMLKNETELMGCRVKVWWPLDKQFYQGIVKSYNSGKKKHLILYDDGEIEVLNLDKEKWELISSESTPRKVQKHKDLTEDIFPEEEHNASTGDDTRKKKISQRTSSSKVRRKSTSNKKRGKKKVLEKISDEATSGDDSYHDDIRTIEVDVKSEKHGSVPMDRENEEHSKMIKEQAGIENDSPSTSGGFMGCNEEGPLEVPEESALEVTHDSPSSDDGDEDSLYSDDETLSAWRQRAVR